MLEINKEKQQIIPHRAPQIEGPDVIRRRKPTPAIPLHEVFKNNKALQFDQSTSFHGGPSARRKGSHLALWSWLASVIDALILVATSCAFILLFSVIVKNSSGGTLAGLTQGTHRLPLFAEVYVLAFWIYMISIRSFMGFSVGEWACDLRLGQPHERLQKRYILRVLLRSSVIIATGVMTLPLLSLIFGKDLAGLCSGLRLFSLK